MGYLGFAFVNLDPTQLTRRRSLLDRTGFICWFFPIIILSLIYITKPSFHSLPSRSTKPSSRIRRLLWVLTSPLPSSISAFSEASNPLHLLVALVYTSVLLFFAISPSFTFSSSTGAGDYMHLTKSLAHTAVSQLPLHFLLATKSPYNPIQLATRLSHESLNPYHRLLGGIVYGLLLAHASLYLNFFAQLGVLGKRVRDADVLFGLGALATLSLLIGLTWKVVRKRAYWRVFYRSHVLLATLLLVCVWMHVRWTRRYVAQAAIFGVLNAIARWVGSTGAVKAEVQELVVESGEVALVKVSITTPPTSPADAGRIDTTTSLAKLISQCAPGQHIYLKSSLAPLAPKNPFTVLAVSHSDPLSLHLVLRNTAGPTTSWLAAAASAERKTKSVPLYLEGPYGDAKFYMPDLLQSLSGDQGATMGPVLLVAGGVGATYTLPIYVALLRRQQELKQQGKLTGDVGSGIHFVWAVREEKEAEWGVRLLTDVGLDMGDVLGVAGSCQIYVTRGTRTKRAQKEEEEGDELKIKRNQVGGGRAEGVMIPNAAASRSTTTATANATAKTTSTSTSRPDKNQDQNPPPRLPPASTIRPTIHHLGTRPDLGALVDEAIRADASDKRLAKKSDVPPQRRGESARVYVLACGPSGLLRELRREVGRHVWMEEEDGGREVVFHEEEFGFG